MLHLLSQPKRLCDGLTRRDLLTAGGLSYLGLSLPDFLRAEAAPTARAGKAKSVILLYLFGGPPKHEMFDPKPEASESVRGPFGTIATDTPGVYFSELFPQMSKWMHRSTLIRSATHPHNDHSAGLLYTMTGKRAKKLESAVPVLPTQAPSINSVIQYLARHERRRLPASVWMPCYTGWGQNSIRPGPYAGFLGKQYDPFFTGVELTNKRGKRDFYDAAIAQGNIVLPQMKLPDELTLDRLDQRRTLLDQLESERRRIDNHPAHDQLDIFKRQALDLLTSSNSPNSPWRAFSLDDEPAALRESYGNNLYGQSILTARRLIEQGVRLVTMTWECLEREGSDPTGWDTHRNHFNIMQKFRAPVLDQAFAGLCADLDSRGLLDETLIVVMGEMGRTPKVGNNAGRNHWSYCYDVLLTGAGVKQGQVFGSSDKIGAYPASHPVGPEAIIATIYEAMGIDSTAIIHDTADRPHPIAQHGKAIDDVLA